MSETLELSVSNFRLYGRVVTKAKAHAEACRLISALEQQRDQLAGFARAILESWPGASALDGGDIQDLAVKHGLLIGQTVNEPCNGGDPDKPCACAEYCFADEFAEGVTCYRRTDLVKAGAA